MFNSLLAAARPIEGSERLQRSARQFSEVINIRVPSVRVETGRDDFTISELAPAPVIPLQPRPAATLGAVQGRVQTLTNRGSLRFTLYDLVNDKPVSCYLAEGYTEQVRGVWGKLAVVEGVVRRNADGRPTTVRDVRSVRLIEGSTGSWRNAIGVVPRGDDHPRAEAVIRKMRDAN